MHASATRTVSNMDQCRSAPTNVVREATDLVLHVMDDQKISGIGSKADAISKLHIQDGSEVCI